MRDALYISIFKHINGTWSWVAMAEYTDMVASEDGFLSRDFAKRSVMKRNFETRYIVRQIDGGYE